MPAKRGHVRERIFRVLLNNKNEKLSKYRIGKEARANISWVIKTLRMLEKDGMVDVTTVTDYGLLAKHWKSVKLKPAIKEYMVRDPLETIRKADLKYALTTYSAENLLQEYLFPARTDFYIMPADMRKWHEILSKNGLVGKGNVRMLMADEHVFYRCFVRDGFMLVSIPQLIVDLMAEGASAMEAAEMLVEKEGRNVIPAL